MGLIKCPRCELNYINEDEKICSVCKREVRGENEQYEMIELCSECGENPAVPGGELCIYCLKELAHRSDENSDEVVVPDDPSIEIDSVSTMDEIDLDIGDDIDDDVFDGEETDEEDEDDEDEDEDEDIIDDDDDDFDDDYLDEDAYDDEDEF